MANEENKSGEQKAAESEVETFQSDLGPFVVAAETTRMPMVFTNAKELDHRIIFANDSFLALTGYTRKELLGETFNSLMEPGADPTALSQIGRAFEGKSDDGPEISFRRKDGTIFQASIFISSVRNNRGDVVQQFASFVDVTKHNREKDRLRLLLEELNHRTQNTLATVLAITRQTLRGMADEEVVDALEGRILALSKTHSLLGRESWDRVGLRKILDQVLQPFDVNDSQGSRFSVEGDDIRLQPKSALTLTMVFHELATNSVKHGALSIEAGGIDISWKVEPLPQGEQMRLRWQESGGPPVTPPTRKGFGSRLIERDLAQDLDGQVWLVYEPTGVVCEIIMPLSQGQVDEHE
jgi:PAS domain S-box-containing protein